MPGPHPGLAHVLEGLPGPGSRLGFGHGNGAVPAAGLVHMGGAEGNFEPNAFRPAPISNYLHSAPILADMCDHFRSFIVEGTPLDRDA
jgi:hypothetical protein